MIDASSWISARIVAEADPDATPRPVGHVVSVGRKNHLDGALAHPFPPQTVNKTGFAPGGTLFKKLNNKNKYTP